MFGVFVVFTMAFFAVLGSGLLTYEFISYIEGTTRFTGFDAPKKKINKPMKAIGGKTTSVAIRATKYERELM